MTSVFNFASVISSLAALCTWNQNTTNKPVIRADMFISPAISDSALKSEKKQIAEIHCTAEERLHLLIEASPSSQGSITAPKGRKKQNKEKINNEMMRRGQSEDDVLGGGWKPCFKDLDKLRDLITLSDWCLKPWISISGRRYIFGSYVGSVSAIWTKPQCQPGVGSVLSVCLF